jgi:hypothetical protein
MAEVLRVVKVVAGELWQHPLMICFLFWIAQGVVGVVLRFRFSYQLNPLFDPVLKKYTENLTDYVPSFTDRYLRAGLYANWVANKSWLGKNRPEVQAVDFRARLSPRTVRLCWFYTINNYCMGIEMVLLAVLIWSGVVSTG